MSERLVWHDKEVMDVIDLLLGCNTRQEIRKIFDRVLTTREINDIARRYKVLMMIGNGFSYVDIKIETGMSATAISRISAKCGFGFRKSASIQKQKSHQTYSRQRSALKYKGVRVR